MTIKHSFKSGKTTITLSWLETRQFLSSSAAREVVHLAVSDIVHGPAPTTTSKIVTKTI